jgi:tetratricopeptide (TPR) repeat protein
MPRAAVVSGARRSRRGGDARLGFPCILALAAAWVGVAAAQARADEPPTDAADAGTGEAGAEESPAERPPPPEGDGPPRHEPPPPEDESPPREPGPAVEPHPEGEGPPVDDPPRHEPRPTDGAAPAAPPADGPRIEHDDDRARAHIRLGRAYYGRGRFEEATREFEKAYAYSGRPELLYDLFLARRDAGHIGEAIEALEQFLELVPDAPERGLLTARLDNMRRLHAQRLRARVPQADDEADEEEGPATADGAQDPGTDGSHTERSSPRADSQPADLEEPPGRSIAPWIVIGLGSAMIVGGAITGGLALRAQKQLEDLCGADGRCPPGSGFEATADRGRSLATSTDVLLGLGLATLGAGVALAFLLDDLSARAPTRPDSPTASLGCGPGGCVGTMRVHF